MFRLFFAACLMLWSIFGWAGECHTPDNAPHIYSANVPTINVTNPANNKAGYTINNAYTWNLGSFYPIVCTCPSSSVTYFTTTTDLPSGHNDGRQFYKVNNNLEVATQIYLAGGVNQYLNTPLDHKSNALASSCNREVMYSSGSSGKMALYIAKPFIGISSFSSDVLSLYATSGPTDPIGPYPVSVVHLAGSIVVPQNCTINAGQTITVDLGTMASSSFKTAGQKPTGMMDKTFNVPIKCANVDGSANLSLRVTATAAAGNPTAIASDNADVGVVVTSEQDNVLTPNISSSAIPFNIDNSGNASVTLKAYPISTTGKKPKEGLFTALATLVIDFA
ncbi:fimbrial protein [Enterobacter asburiae]|uniref:fimbrial protein n=1 Tax=Enterobacter asburiae TaxID=61645 RepID=UPI001880AE9E|nr:fimbrial protein [Enterobacter asburiae]QOV79490.1 fimbrial protein [Enterobacter asburiae]